MRGNRIRYNRMDGIAIEHGSDNLIERNVISGNRNGVRLWWAPSELGDDPSTCYVIRDNQITESRVHAIDITDTTDVPSNPTACTPTKAGLFAQWCHIQHQE